MPHSLMSYCQRTCVIIEQLARIELLSAYLCYNKTVGQDCSVVPWLGGGPPEQEINKLVFWHVNICLDEQ